MTFVIYNATTFKFNESYYEPIKVICSNNQHFEYSQTCIDMDTYFAKWDRQIAYYQQWVIEVWIYDKCDIKICDINIVTPWFISWGKKSDICSWLKNHYQISN